MSVQSQIDRISQNISDSYSAIEERGGTLPQIQNSDNLENAIRSIQKGDVVTYLINAPIGAIIQWSGTENSVPEGWSICNGENGTIDLSGKFVLSAGNGYSVGATGGSDKVTLTVEQMPSHSHLYETVHSTLENKGFFSGGYNAAEGTKENETQVSGGNQPHENMPPYYTLLFIQKIGTTPTDYMSEEQVQNIVDNALQNISTGMTQADADQRYLKLSGGTMSGQIDMHSAMITNVGLLGVIPRISPYGLPPSFTGMLSERSGLSFYYNLAPATLNIGEPSLDGHAATKKYVDDAITASITSAIEEAY